MSWLSVEWIRLSAWFFASAPSRRFLSSSANCSASLDHLLDVGVLQTARRLNADLLFLAGALVLGVDVDDAVGVDVEGDLDLRNAARRRRNADQVELAKRLVVRRHFALALEDADRDGILVVVGGREGLALLGRNGRVAIDHPGEDAAQRLDAKATAA